MERELLWLLKLSRFSARGFGCIETGFMFRLFRRISHKPVSAQPRALNSKQGVRDVDETPFPKP